ATAYSAQPPDVAGVAQLIDVRRAETYALATDTLRGAVWRDPTKLAAWSTELDASRPVLVYCVHGLDIGRSSALWLRARGFDARCVAGGIEACRAAGVAMSPKE